MGHHPDRNTQFENIARLRHEFQNAGQPIISIGTKQKELLGNFHRPAPAYTEQPSKHSTTISPVPDKAN